MAQLTHSHATHCSQAVSLRLPVAVHKQSAYGCQRLGWSGCLPIPGYLTVHSDARWEPWHPLLMRMCIYLHLLNLHRFSLLLLNSSQISTNLFCDHVCIWNMVPVWGGFLEWVPETICFSLPMVLSWWKGGWGCSSIPQSGGICWGSTLGFC